MNLGNRTKLFIAAIFGVLSSLYIQNHVTTRATACTKPWVFFDLGNTLVDSNPGEEMKYISGAHEYVKQLKRRGYRIGMITNVPEKWGPSSKEKVRSLKKTLMESWSRDPSQDPMDWNDFADALIFTPPRDEYRKPAPYLFKAALSQVILEEGETHCKVIFQGEDPKEVAAAKQEGMVGYLVNGDPKNPFLPIDQLELKR